MTRTKLDPVPILASLGVTDATVSQPVAGGSDTALWRVEHGGLVSALRVFRPEQIETCRREVLAMRAAADAGIPVPSVRAEGVWHDRPALLLSWCAGRTLLAELSARPWRVWRLGTALGRMQARIHAVSALGALRPHANAWIGWAGPEEEPLQARLRALPLRTYALLHLDYHPLNVMTDGREITGVLDWANADAGDPRADLARTVALLRLPSLPPGAFHPAMAAFRRVLELAWRRGYDALAGSPGDLALFHAWSGAMMVRDLGPKAGQPGVWLPLSDLDRMRRWTAYWKRRAGVAP